MSQHQVLGSYDVISVWLVLHLSDSSLICTVPAQWLVILDTKRLFFYILLRSDNSVLLKDPGVYLKPGIN